MGFMPRAEPPARKKKVSTPVGSNVAAHIDFILAMDDDIREVEASLRALKQEREKRAAKALAAMQEAEMDGCKGKVAIANIKRTRHPGIKDRAKLDKFILKNKALHLLQNRIVNSVYFEMLEEGIAVPGVEVFDKVSLSITKRRK